MPDYREIYAQHAERYDALVAHEDHQGQLAQCLETLCETLSPGNALEVVETGAGTGRLTRLLAPRAKRILAFDASPAMIAVAAHSLRGFPHVHCERALHDALPVATACADLALEGWAFGHALGWNPTAWREELVRWTNELDRVLRPGGCAVLIETMGTGVETPFAGGHTLEPFHAFVTEVLGFEHRMVRTDYAFASVTEACELLGFFFSESLVSRVRERAWTHVPECTGIYTRRRST